MNTAPTRCTRCILPDTVPGIAFDDAGVCDYCREWTASEVLGEAALREITEVAKAAAGDFDAIVPLSGGRDSSFVLHEAVRTFGLRPLAVNYDNEFRNDQAVANMERACEVLGVTLLSIRSRLGIASKVVRDELRLNAAAGLPPVSVCRACTYGYKSVVYRTAIERGVPLILWGTSSHEKTDAVRKRAFRGLARRRSRLSRLADPDFDRLVFHSVLQRLEFPVPGTPLLSSALPVLRSSGVTEVSFFDYVPWDRTGIKDTIMNELGWEKPAGSVSTWRTDCALHACVNFSYLALFGCTKDCFGYTNMINAGQMDRPEALRQEEEAIRELSRGLAELLRTRVGLPEAVVAALLDAPAARVGARPSAHGRP